MTRRQPVSTRLVRRVLGGTMLGALVITGPWTVPAAGHDGPPTGPRRWSAGPIESRGPEPRERTGLYDAPFGPFPGTRRERPKPTVAVEAAWTTPVSGHLVSAPYGIPGGWAAGHHTGVDFATPMGTPVQAVGAGTVVLAEYSGDYGNAVIIKMTDGYYTLYAHLSEISVRQGRQVKAGTTIGESGNTGNSTGPHLHFEVRQGRGYGTDVDPMGYLAGNGVNLS